MHRRLELESPHNIIPTLNSFLFMILVLQVVAGRDATKQFKKYHREAILNQYKEKLQVGSLDADDKPKSGSTLSFGFLRRKSKLG